MSQPDLQRRPFYPRLSPRKANERYAHYFPPFDDEPRPLSVADVPSSPLSAVSGAESWSGSSNTQEQFTPPTPDFCFPPVAVATIATPGEITVSCTEDHKGSLPSLPPEETSQVKIVHRVDKSVPIGVQHEIGPHPIAIKCETRRLLPYDLPAPASPANTPTQLPTAVRLRKVQQVPQKHVSWSSAIVSDSPSIPLDLDTRIPHIAPVEPFPEDEVKKVQSFLRELRDFDNLESRPTQQDRLPALRCDKTPLLSPEKSQDGPSDKFSWKARHSGFVDPDELADQTRYSLLIQEVSLMVGLTSDDDNPNLDDGSLPKSLPVPSKLGHPGHSTTVPLGLQSPLPLSIAPVEFLASRRRENTLLPSRRIDPQGYPSKIIPSDDDPHVKNTNPGAHSDYPFLKETSPPIRLRGSAVSIPRHKSVDAIHPSAQSRRRHGQVFQFDRSTDKTPPVSYVDINGTPVYPRQSVSKPLPNLPPSRLSSLNRLEYSLEKLKAHAPANHHKSQSEGTSPGYLGWKDKPTVLRKQQSNYEISQRRALRPACGRHFSNPMPSASGSAPANCHAAKPTPLTPPSEDEQLSTPGSFMDMDIPPTQKAPQKKRISFRNATNNEKMKNFVQTAKRVSLRVITWGKNLAGPSKLSVNGVKTTPIASSYI